MDHWTFIVAIVAMSLTANLIRTAISKSAKNREMKPEHLERIGALEQRIQNLETLVLELEKDRKYQNLK
jgi:hypothetical protein